MTTTFERAATHLNELLSSTSLDELAGRLRPKPGGRQPAVPGGARISPRAVAKRWRLLDRAPEVAAELLDSHTVRQMAAYRRNVEHFVGTVKVPVGIAGPLRVNGLFAQGTYYVPLATTEAALVASYSRGASVITEAGGASAVLLNEGVSRAPGFSFTSFEEVGRFLSWLLGNRDAVRRVSEGTTRHGRLLDLQVNVEGNHVYVLLTFSTGDAAGQNMVTIATDAAVRWIVEHSPVKPTAAYLEANFSGDKKATAQSFIGVRGRKVSAEVSLPAQLVRDRLHTTVDAIAACARVGAMGGVLSGTLGVQGHYANGLAALFIACGQDAACVAEAAVGVTRLEPTPAGDLYAAVTLPNLIVGSVGGGTGLPSQRACLDVLGLAGPGHAQAFAEVAACLALAGEISVTGAICAGEFARAHARLARGSRAQRV